MLRPRNNFPPVRCLSSLCVVCSFFTLLYDRKRWVSLRGLQLTCVGMATFWGERLGFTPWKPPELGPLLTGVGCGVRKSTSLCRVLGNRCFSFGKTRPPLFRYLASIRSPHRPCHPERWRRQPPVALFDERNSQAVPSARRAQEPLPGSARPRARSAPLFRPGRGGQRPSCGALRGSSSRGR